MLGNSPHSLQSVDERFSKFPIFMWLPLSVSSEAWKVRRLSRFPHPLERCRPGRPHFEASQGGVREIIVVTCDLCLNFWLVPARPPLRIQSGIETIFAEQNDFIGAQAGAVNATTSNIGLQL